MFPFNEKKSGKTWISVFCYCDTHLTGLDDHMSFISIWHVRELSLHFKIQFKNRNPNLRLHWLLTQHLLSYYWCSKNINIILLYYWCSKNMWGEVQEWEESRIFYILVQRATNCKPLITSNLFVQKAQNINYGMKMWTSSL